MTDHVETVRAALEGAWVPANTDGITPTFHKIVSLREVNTSGNRDAVAVYSIDENEEQKGIGYTAYGYEMSVSFSLWTSTSHAHLIRMKEEAHRIVRTLRKTLVSDAVWRHLHTVDVSDKRSAMYKAIVDTRLKWYLKVIA